MTITMARHTYGVQVGNETYSLVVTDEDWEKRKFERERQKRLSQETNRRRKALEEKKKLAEEREARKRALQLSKRKQRQTEATERYQRAHIMVKHGNRTNDRKNMALDDVLQQLRSGSTEINYISPSNNLDSTTKQSATEPTLQEKQQRILHEHKLYTAQEFYNELGNHSSPTSYLTNNNRSETPDHNRHYNDNAYKHSYRPTLSNIDLMSGQTYHHSPAPHPNSNDYSHLPDSISKLFVKQDEEHKPPTNISHRYDASQLQLEDAEEVVQSPIVQPKVYDNATTPSFTSSSPKHELYSHTLTDSHKPEFPDDQDSLHGSNSSRNSPISNYMTSFHKKYADEKEIQRENELNRLDKGEKPSVTFSIPSQLNQPAASFSSNIQSASSQFSVSFSNPVSVQSPVQSPPVKQPIIISSPQPISHTSAAQSPLSDYYVKSYRPFSAAEVHNAIKQEKESKTRPKSAAVHRPPMVEPTQPRTPSQTVASVTTADVSSVSTVKWATSPVKTTATPISDLYSDTWTKVFSQSKTTSATHNTSTSLAQGTSGDSKVSFKTSTSPGSSSQKSSVSTPAESSEQLSSTQKFKSILRKVSKYDSPHYHSAAAARLKWVEHINSSTSKRCSPSIQTAKLHDTEVRDSLDVNRNGSARSKSVRWHEIQFDDGTSATLTDPSAALKKAIKIVNQIPSPVSQQPVKTAADKSLRNRPSSAKSKPRPPPDHDKSIRKSSKMARNRKLRAANKLQVALAPHPPPPVEIPTKTAPISKPSNVATSPDKDRSVSSAEQARKPVPYRVAWVNDEKNKVTFDNLKSSGSPPHGHSSSPTRSKEPEPRIDVQITSPSNVIDNSNSINLNKTPTDQEINWLWDKVRSCMAQRPNSRGIPISKTLSDSGLSRNFENRSMRGPSPASPQQHANVVSIDGGMFSDNVVQSRTRRLARPSSAVMASAKQRLHTYNASIRRQALLQHRRNKQFAPNRVKNEQVAGPRRYPTPRMSYFDPYPSSRPTTKVDESTTAFLLAETLAEQNMTEEQIVKAMDSLQRKTKEARSHKTEVNPSSLSLEEHRLLQSLERLNTRLHEVESAVATNPNFNYFDKIPLSAGSQRDYRAHPAETGHRRSSARY